MQFKTFYWLSHYGYTIIYKYGKRTRQLKFESQLKNLPSRNNGGQQKPPWFNGKEVIELLEDLSNHLEGVFNETIIPLALAGYEMIKANSALRASLAIYLLISNARSWNNS